MVVWTRNRAFAAREFWNEKQPSAWTAAEIDELLRKSPWARDANIHDNAPVGSLGAGRSGGGGRRGGRAGGASSGTSSTASNVPFGGAWKAVVRWESALPIREGLKTVDLPGIAESYVLNVVGNLPGPAIDSNASAEEQRHTLEVLQDHTKLEHKGDEIALSHVAVAPKSDVSPAGTLYYFPRELALQLSDKEVTFMTRTATIEVKCKFALREMIYRGNLEL